MCVSENENRVYISMSDARSKMANKVIEEMTNFYNQHGIAWPPGSMTPLNALAFRFFMEGLFKHGIIVKDENHFTFNEFKFRETMEGKQ